jgi:zinc transport system substrate-binding protein
MKIRRHSVKTVIGLLGFYIILTASASTSSDLVKPKVYVTNYPLKYFVERIAGESVAVVFPIPEGLDPIFWMPNPESITDMQKAELIILNGATYEKWLPLVSLQPSKIVDTSIGFKDLYIHTPDSITHSHGSQGEHSHGGIRHTTWLDFYLASKQAKAIERSLSRVLPNSKQELRKRYLALEKDLIKLDQDFSQVFASISNQRILAAHPEYSYLARRYSLNLRSLLWSPEVMPSPDEWKEVQNLLNEYPAKWIIWKKEPIKESTKKLDAMGIRNLIFHPCGNATEGDDFVSMMYQNLDHLRKAFESEK